jgi:hypothetical protein
MDYCEDSKDVPKAKGLSSLLAALKKAQLVVDGGYRQPTLYIWVDCPLERLQTEWKKARYIYLPAKYPCINVAAVEYRIGSTMLDYKMSRT